MDLSPVERLILVQAVKDPGWTTITGNLHTVAFHLSAKGLGEARDTDATNVAMFKPNDAGRAAVQVH